MNTGSTWTCLGRPGFYIFFASPYLLGLGLWLVRRKRDADQADLVGFRQRNARRIAKKALAEAAKQLKSGEEKAYFETVSLAIRRYLANKLKTDIGSLSKESLAEHLGERNVPAEDIQKLIRLLKDCEMALYAPGAVAGGKEGVYQQAEDLISQLENQLV